jgi:hypothetical protein
MARQILFGSDIGLLSLFTIGFVIVMAIYMMTFYRRKIAEDLQNKSK